MSAITDILNMPVNELKPLLSKLKKWVKARDDYYNHYNTFDYADFSKQLKTENPWTKGKTMKKVFSIPMDVYVHNPKYWDGIIKNKQFNKHPEWMT